MTVGKRVRVGPCVHAFRHTCSPLSWIFWKDSIAERENWDFMMSRL